MILEAILVIVILATMVGLLYAATKPTKEEEAIRAVATVIEQEPAPVAEVKEEPVKEVKPEEKPKRARKANGRFKGDDPTTPDVNEAWVGGKAPKKKTKAKSKAKEKTLPKSKKPKIKIVK